jgi:hypothetical protein
MLVPMGRPECVQLFHSLEQLEDHVGPLRAGGVLPRCIQEGEASLVGDGVVGVV